MIPLGDPASSQVANERWLFRKVGFQLEPKLVIVSKLSSLAQTFYCFSQQRSETLRAAHEYIQEHWEELASGQVIDVDFIQGRREQPRTSERLS